MPSNQPILLCGMGRVGWRVLHYLQTAKLPVVVIDTNCSPEDPRLNSAVLISGDFRKRENLEKAGVKQARGVIIMTNDDMVNISAALQVRSLNPEVRIVLRMFNQDMVERLGKAFKNVFALSTSTLTAPLFALTAMTGQGLGSLRLDNTRSGLRQVADIQVSSHSYLRGLTIASASARSRLKILAYLPRAGEPRLLLDVREGDTLAAGDHIIVCGHPQDVAPLLESDSMPLGEIRWAGWLRRTGRVILRTLREVDVAVKISGAVLVAVVILGTWVLYWRVKSYDFEHALFRAISLLATGADMHGEDYEGQPGLKAFAGILRILGAALIATFTAIFTNYLLRARLSGTLEFRRIPDGGHYVICGLGNIGYRVIEELVKYGERVVVIEISRDSRFVTTARRLGVPVLIGDATVGAVLEQAHARQARAVIVTTSDDLVNLETALMVRELAPRKRVVIHMSDAHLAHMLREAVNIELALSIPQLAAPAFLAGLYGDRVQSVFMIGGRMLAAVDILVQPDDPCLVGRSVCSAAYDYGLAPIGVFDLQGKLLDQPMETILQPGFRIVAVSLVSDLERLLRRESAARRYALKVVAMPAQVRNRVAHFVAAKQGKDVAEILRLLAVLPCNLANGMTRGQAEELRRILQSDSVIAEVLMVEEDRPTLAREPIRESPPVS